MVGNAPRFPFTLVLQKPLGDVMVITWMLSVCSLFELSSDGFLRYFSLEVDRMTLPSSPLCISIALLFLFVCHDTTSGRKRRNPDLSVKDETFTRWVCVGAWPSAPSFDGLQIIPVLMTDERCVHCVCFSRNNQRIKDRRTNMQLTPT